VDQPGSGYTAPLVTFSGNGGAAATAYGGVDAVTITFGGSGYTFPTVEFDLPDGPDGLQAKGHVPMIVNGDPFDGMDANGTITAVVVDNPGSGYSFAPGVAIHNGTLYDPIPGATLATATTSLAISSIALDTFGADYNNPPTVDITDPTGTGALATAVLDNGVISAITLKKGGSGYLTAGGIRKFVDTLPGLTSAGANNLGQYIPLGVPDTTTFPGADYYEIAVVEYQERMHTDLPPTKLRGYVQLETSVVTAAITPCRAASSVWTCLISWDRPSSPRETGLSGSRSTTCYRQGPRATCSCQLTRPSWARARPLTTICTTQSQRLAAMSWMRRATRCAVKSISIR